MTDLRDQLADFEAAAQRALTHHRPQPIAITHGRDLGPLLRRLRQDAGLTLDQLGQRVHVSRRGVCARELHGVALPTAALIETADALGYDLALIPREDKP